MNSKGNKDFKRKNSGENQGRKSTQYQLLLRRCIADEKFAFIIWNSTSNTSARELSKLWSLGKQDLTFIS